MRVCGRVLGVCVPVCCARGCVCSRECSCVLICVSESVHLCAPVLFVWTYVYKGACKSGPEPRTCVYECVSMLGVGVVCVCVESVDGTPVPALSAQSRYVERRSVL